MSDESETAALLLHRASMTEEYDAGTFDQCSAYWVCASCDEDVPDHSLRVIAFSPYGDLEELLGFAQRCAEGVSEEDAPACTCGGESRLSHVELHAFHGGRKQDIVVRVVLGAAQAYWWAPASGYAKLEELSETHALELRLSALVRQSSTFGMDEAGAERLAAATREALAQAPGHELLLPLIGPLLGSGHAPLGLEVAQAHTQHNPADPWGPAWQAEITTQGVNARAIPFDALEDVEGLVEQALSLDAEFVPAILTRSTVHRMRQDEPAARADLERVVAIGKDRVAEAHYNLGVMDLEANPESALAHFVAGQALDEGDPDYPLGCARALVRLGRTEEAKAALEEARELAPEHPRILELEQALGVKSGNSIKKRFGGKN